MPADPAASPGASSSPSAVAIMPATAPGHHHHEGSVKETVESILVAFILAFIFRAFVVEAFVIPTGSMAPTLLGAHVRMRCDDCGYRWTVNFSNGSGNEDQIPATARTVRNEPITYNGDSPPWAFQPKLRCPNCGFLVPERSAQDPDNDGSEPPVHYGDRILVLKYLYLFQEPERWDVVVFKSPSERGGDASQLRYSANYIKRLVGRPGESVMILDGDIYVGQKDQELEKFQVQRKPKHVQDALWRVVYDNDFVPRGLPRDGESWQQPWTRTEGSGWELGNGQAQRAFKFDNRYEAGTLEFDPEKIPGTNALTDWLAYDEVQEDLPRNVNGYAGNRVKPALSDLKLSLYYHRRGGDGPLSLHLSKGADVFTADLVPGKAILTRHTTGKAPETLAEVPVNDLAGNNPVHVEFVNVDYRVSLYVNGKRVLQTTDIQYHATEEVVRGLLDSKNTRQPKPSVRISAANQQCSVEHLSLSRDIYYLNGHPHDTMLSRPIWGTPENVIELGPDDYFVLGDNSLISGDARGWDEDVALPAESLYVQAGRVPRRFMLGKAFFVYWPAGYRPFNTRFGVVPNFGEMRFIH